MTLDLSITLAVLSQAGGILGAGRVFFVVEAKIAEHSRAIEKFDRVAEKFNGEAQSSFHALKEKVDNLEKDIAKLATVERVDAIEKAIITEMRQSFRHLTDLISLQRHHDKDDA